MAADDDATQEAGPLPTTELDPAPTAVAGPLAYSAHTSSMPVVEYQPPNRLPVWIAATVLVVAAIAVAAATFILGRTTAPQNIQAVPANPPASTAPPPATTTPLPTPTVVSPAPPPVTATVTPPAEPTTTTSVPPLATPEARIAEPIICSLHNQYPQMQPVDLALSLIDRGIYRDYDDAALVVGLVLRDGCHGI